MKTNCGSRHRGLKELKAGGTTSWAALDKLSDVRRHPSPLVAVCDEVTDSGFNAWVACIGVVRCVDEAHLVFTDVEHVGKRCGSRDVGGRSTQRGSIEDTNDGGVGVVVVRLDWLGPIEVLASVRSKQKHPAESIGGTDVKSAVVLRKTNELHAVHDACGLHKEIVRESVTIRHEQTVFLPRVWGALFLNGGK